MNEELHIRIGDGYLVATKSSNPDYPGIDIEYVADNDNGENKSRPRVLVEQVSGEQDRHLRVLIWNDSDEEDYREDIYLTAIPTQQTERR